LGFLRDLKQPRKSTERLLRKPLHWKPQADGKIRPPEAAFKRTFLGTDCVCAKAFPPVSYSCLSIPSDWPLLAGLTVYLKTALPYRPLLAPSSGQAEPSQENITGDWGDLSLCKLGAGHTVPIVTAPASGPGTRLALGFLCTVLRRLGGEERDTDLKASVLLGEETSEGLYWTGFLDLFLCRYKGDVCKCAHVCSLSGGRSVSA
jgi:hypothetical protein